MKAILTALVVLSAVHLSFAQPTTESVAVLTFEPKVGITDPETSLLADRFESELIKTRRYAVVSRSRLKDILEAQKFSMTCSDAECAIEVGKILSIQNIVYGTIGKIGNTFSVVVNIADVETAQIVHTATFDWRGDVDNLLTTGMGTTVRRLLGLESPEDVAHSQPESSERDQAPFGRKNHLYCLGDWLLYWPGDDIDVYLWRDNAEYAVEIVGNANGWWKWKEYDRENVVYPAAGNLERQDFFNQPWTSLISTLPTAVAAGSSFNIIGDDGRTVISFDGSTITINLPDGGKLSIPSRSYQITFVNYDHEKYTYP